MITVYALASEFDKEYPREESARLAQRAVRSLTDQERADLLIRLMAAEIDAIRRSRARDIEHRSWAAAKAPPPVNEAWAVYKRQQAADAKKEKAERAQADAERALLWATDPEAYRRRYTLGGIMDAFEEQTRTDERLKVTAELLTVVFSVGDGRRVTWGEATLEDHRQRIELLAKGIEGNVQTIRLHEHAAAILRETGAHSLNASGAITV